MSVCPNCNRQLQGNSNFCNICGYQIATSNYPQPILVYIPHKPPNRQAKASLALSIVAIGIAVLLIIPSFCAGGLLMSCAGQSPWASGVDVYDPIALEEYWRDSRNLGMWAIWTMLGPPTVSIALSVLGLIFGLIGLGKRKLGMSIKGAVAGIVISVIVLGWGVIAFALTLFLF